MTRVVVVGAGVAGLTAALELAERPGVEVTLVAKAPLRESNTRYAQGGIAVVTGEPDTVASHVADTLVAGAGLSDEPAAEVLCSDGPEAVAALIRRGVRFDVEDGQLARGLEAAHAHPRILHAGGDATGAAIADGLLAALGRSRVTVRAETTVVELLRDDHGVSGVRLLGGETLAADAVVLATGGAGQLYPYTTNPAVATGDGIALALRAGAVAADLEFYQFHPTSLAAPGNHLVSEAVRGEGAVLLDADGRRFMTGVHPDAELAPRDVVARGIAAQMAAQNGVPVRLDATAMGAEFLARRFPTIDAVVRSQGFDWAREPLPVTPAAHYFMGGVRTDVWGRTSVPGLFAVGEVACNGLHGANRLASNSLLEGAVYGRRVARAVLDEPEASTFGERWAEPFEIHESAGTVQGSRADLQQLMWDAAGLVRDGSGLAEAADELASWRMPEPVDAKAAEDAALLLVARAVVTSAAARTESRGGHHRTDGVSTAGPPAVSDSRPGPGTPAVSDSRPGPGTPAVHSGVVLR